MMEQVLGYVERIVFRNKENGYTVACVKECKQTALITVVGHLPLVEPGQKIHCRGSWHHHSKFGRQFLVDQCTMQEFTDAQGIEKYLSSGLIQGIGAHYAKKIVSHFGEKTLDILDHSPKRLQEVKGIGKKRLEKIAASWDEQRDIRDVMLFLQQYQVSAAYAQKIYRKYGQASVAKVQENPYCLAREIHGIGFKIADAIAQKIGIGKESSQRLDAGIEHVLFDLSKEGHTCYPTASFLTEAEKILEVDREKISHHLSSPEKEARVIQQMLKLNDKEEEFIWLHFFYFSEQGIAKELHRLSSCLPKQNFAAYRDQLSRIEKEKGLCLACNQHLAVNQALLEKVSIITGGPGTGKSTITQLILSIARQITRKILLAAPTGRAAKRLAQVTQCDAFTIHSILSFDFKTGSFLRNRDRPLTCDLIIIDEASMIDTLLMYALLKAIPDTARVVFIGDIHQLPSVGPGNVLKDCIQSQCIPTVRLNEIFRQAADSQIITNAHRVHQGLFPHFSSNSSQGDFFFIPRENPEEILRLLIDVVVFRLPKRYGFCPFSDIQVLVPMKKGVLGIDNINVVLQQALNTETNGVSRMGYRFLVGDKVMQIRNQYEKEVFNGDLGRIVAYNHQEEQLLVKVDDRIIEYSASELDDLVLAYASSVHKFQGSECPCIVIVMHTSHFMLLQRNLFYTAITRGKKLVVLIGSKKAVAIAVNNDAVKHRYTSLKTVFSQYDSWNSSTDLITIK